MGKLSILVMHKNDVTEEFHGVSGVNICFKTKTAFVTYIDDEKGMHRPPAIYCNGLAGFFVGFSAAPKNKGKPIRPLHR